MKFTFSFATRPATQARARSLRRGLLLSASAGWALSHAALPARAQGQAATPAQNSAAQKALRLAQSQEVAGSLGLAAAGFRDAAAQAPTDVPIARELARFYSRQSRLSEARLAWMRVGELQHGDAEAACELAHLRPLIEVAGEGARVSGIANDAPLPPAEGFSPRTRAVASTKTKRLSKLPPVWAPRTDTFLAQIPASELPSLPEALGTPTLEAPAPAPDTSASAPGTGASADSPSTPENATPTLGNGAPSTGNDSTAPANGAPSTGNGAATTNNAVPAAGTDATPTEAAPATSSATPSIPATELPSNPTVNSTELPATTSPTTTSPATEASTRSTATRPAFSPVAAPVRVTPVAFAPPTPTGVRVSPKQAARAWPFVNRGAKLLNQKKAQQALAEYQSAAKIDPTNVYALPGVATSQIILGRFDAAAQTYRRFLALKPNDASGLRGLADALTFGRRYPEALGVNNYILATRDSRNFAAIFQNGQIYTFLKSYQNADAAFSRAVALQPNNVEVLVARGESLSYRRDGRAVASFQNALKLSPGNPRASLGLGNYYLYSGQFALAVPRLRQLTAAQPTNIAALVALGDALSFNGQSAQAVAPYGSALKLAPANLQDRVGLGRALVFSGSTNEGATQLNRVLAEQPDNAGALEALALAQSKSNPAASIANYRRLLSLQRRDPAARARTLASLGDVQTGQNDFAAATRSYAQAVQLAPSDVRLNLTYAQLLSFQNEWEATAIAARRVLALSPGNAQAQALELRAALQTSDTATATALAAQLENAAPQNAQASLDLAQAMREAGNTAAASRLLQLAVTQTNDPAIWLKLGEATRDSGNHVDATAIYGRLLQAQPNNRAARLGLARTLLYARNLSTAQTQVSQLLALSPNDVQVQLLAAQVQLRLDTPTSRDEAARLANQVLAANPNATQGQALIDNAEARTILAQALTARQRFTDAVTQSQAAIAADPNNLEARLILARNLNYSRDFEGAITQYRELIGRAPADALPRLELAQILLDRSRYSEAETLFNEVLVLRRGAAVLPAVRRAIAANSLARLSPLMRDDSPIFLRVAALIQLRHQPVSRLPHSSATSVQAAPNAPISPHKQPLLRLAQNTTASGPTVPSTTGSLGTGIGGGTLGTGTLDSGTGGTPVTPDTSANTSSAPTPPTASNAGSASSTPLPSPALPAVTLNSIAATPTAPLNVPAPTAPDGSGASSKATGSAGTGSGGELSSPLATIQGDQGAALRGLGESRRRQNQFAEAITFFTQALTLNPNDVPARVGLAQSLRGQNQFALAQQQVASALALDPASIPARVLSAQLLADTGQSAEANTQLNALVGSLPADAPLESYTQLALALNSVSNFPASLDLLGRAVAQFPTDSGIARLRAETLGFAGQTDPAIAAFDAVLATDPKDSDALLGRARVFNYANRLPEAETAYRQFLSALPANFSAQSELADVLGRRGNFSEAITLYGQAIAQNPADLPVRINLARLQRSANQTSDAEATLNQVLDADPNNVAALAERGSLRGSQGSYAAGLADLNRAISLSPNDVNAQLGLAQVQSYAGNYPQSIASYRTFLERNPNNTQGRVELAQTLSYAGRSPEALREIDIVLAQTPGFAGAQLARAEILTRSNRAPEAIAQLNAVLSSDPNNVRARTSLADAFLSTRRYTDAIRVYDHLLQAQPNNTALQISRARALSYAGRSKEAVTALRTIVAADATDIPARLALAEAGANSGDATLQRDAIGEYRQVIKQNPGNLNAQLGLARVLSYRGQLGESKAILGRILAANPNNNEARLALGDTERFAGDAFGAKKNYQIAAKNGGGQAAQNGLNSVFKATAPSIGVNGSYYHDSNGVNLRSVGENAFLRTRLLTIGVLANQGKFRQRGFAERNRTNIGLLLARQLGPFQAQLIVSRLKYSGVKEKTLYDLAFGRDFNARSRVNLSFARRDIFESELAVSRGITADTVNIRYTLPLGSRLDLETVGAYYNYSDNNSRVTASPSLFFRFNPTNPTLRVGVGYTYDNTRQTRDNPFVYYTPQNFNAASILADYIVTQNATRFGLSGAYPLTTSTGRGGLNRPAATLFGFVERDLSRNFDVFINGGLVRVPNGSFHSEQVTGGVNLRF